MTIVYIACVIILIFGIVVFRGAPYVPSHPKQVKKAFTELYPLDKSDTLIDVGSGDGIILRLAAQRGARTIGYELNPILVIVSKILGRHYKGMDTRLADFWLVDIPQEATIVYAFAVSRDTKKLLGKLEQAAQHRQKPLMAMTYGAPLPRMSIRDMGAHHLYQFDPPKKTGQKTLQRQKP